MTCKWQGTFDIIVWKYCEWVYVWVLVSRPFNIDCVVIALISITEMKDEQPLICVDGRHLTVAEPHDVHLGGAVNVVLDLVLQLPVHKYDFKKVCIHVPWRVKNNGIIGGHCKSVLHRWSFDRNASYLYFLECVGTFELVYQEIHVEGLLVEIAAYTNIRPIRHFLWVRDTCRA